MNFKNVKVIEFWEANYLAHHSNGDVSHPKSLHRFPTSDQKCRIILIIIYIQYKSREKTNKWEEFCPIVI